MAPSLCLTFPSLTALPDFAHAFTLRHPEIEVAVDREEALRRLEAWHLEIVEMLGFSEGQFATVKQVHGNTVRCVGADERGEIGEADGLVSNLAGVMLGIYVADCGAVHLVDPVRRAIGLLHSGRKGTEQNITGVAIRLMQERFGTRAEDLIVQLAPCIRPPAYEVDFAAAIRDQAREAGVKADRIHDDRTCTSSDLGRFYSYRMEKGRTGRMLALLGLRGSA
jgi:copper oxidase (laccase) domain-containing protein